MLFRGSTLDDVMFRVLRSLLVSRRAISVQASRGATKELVGALIRVDDPRARLSIASIRSQLFSCLGELFWYLGGSGDLSHIEYYVRAYSDESSDGRTVPSAYGPRLYHMNGVNQLNSIVELLRANPTSRRAVIQLFDARDLFLDVSPPCTCFLQFLIRGGRLHAFVSMRSNDAYLGLPHDMFAFTMIQELLARELGLELGTYSHAVGSMHLYAKHETYAQRYLDEGFQDRVSMPPMPAGSPRRSVLRLLAFERSVRIGSPKSRLLAGLDNYWLDIARLISIYGAYKRKEISELERLRGEMDSRVFDYAIAHRSRQLRRRRPMVQGRLFDKPTSTGV